MDSTIHVHRIIRGKSGIRVSGSHGRPPPHLQRESEPVILHVMPYKDYNAQMKKYVLDRYHRLRAEFIDKMGGSCQSCGSTDRIEFDHVDPRTKSFNISKVWSYKRATVEEELAKCQLLCYGCHKDKTSRGA